VGLLLRCLGTVEGDYNHRRDLAGVRKLRKLGETLTSRCLALLETCQEGKDVSGRLIQVNADRYLDSYVNSLLLRGILVQDSHWETSATNREKRTVEIVQRELVGTESG
jgi:hypothetical protein